MDDTILVLVTLLGHTLKTGPYFPNDAYISGNKSSMNLKPSMMVDICTSNNLRTRSRDQPVFCRSDL